MLQSGRAYSLYIHVPFCTRKCDYCHFYVIPDKESHKKLYLEALRSELRTNKAEGNPVSLYFGGGTPSLLAPDAIAEIIDTIAPPSTCEITLEANPETVSQTRMEAFRAAGVNRISLGVQTFDSPLLGTLGRLHTADKAREAIMTTSEAGFDNISIDLMYDLPHQTVESWERTLAEIRTLPITHLSLYNLTIEPHTVFFKKRASLALPDEETSLTMLQRAIETLRLAGFGRYEISAFAKEGFYSRHNTGYWTGRPFLGLGPSAFSYWENRRFRNSANLNIYARQIRAGVEPIDFEETLSPTARLKEALAIRLRLLEPFDLPLNLPQETITSLQELQQQGLVTVEDNKISLTERGTLFYDTVATELIE